MIKDNIYSPVIIEVEKEVIDNLSDFFAEYEAIDTLHIIEKSKADKILPIVVKNFDNFKEIDELIEKYVNDEVSYIVYIWDTIYSKAWEEINKG